MTGILRGVLLRSLGAWETPEGGVFTDAWLEGVSDGAADINGDGVVTNAELVVHMRKASEAWCAANLSCRATGLGLTPDVSGDVLGLVAARHPAAAAPQEAHPTPAPAATVPAASNRHAAAHEALAAAPGRDTARAFVTDLVAASNAAGLTIDISTDGPMRLGDTVSFTVTTERAGTLLLLCVNPEGDLFQIFPSRLSVAEAAAVSAGEAVRIPGPSATSGRPMRIRGTAPAGDGMLLALLVESEAPVFETNLPRDLELAPIPNATQYLHEIGRSLLEMQVDLHNAKVEADIAGPGYPRSPVESRKAIIRPERKAKIVDAVHAFGRPIFAIYDYGHFLIENMSPKTTEKLNEGLRYGGLLVRREDHRIDADQKRVPIESTGLLQRYYVASRLQLRGDIAGNAGNAGVSVAENETDQNSLAQRDR